MNVPMVILITVLYFGIGIIVSAFAIRSKRVRNSAGDFLLGILVWPIFLIGFFDDAKRKASSEQYRREIEYAIKVQPRCGRYLKFRQRDYPSSVGLFTVSASACHTLLQAESVTERSPLPWPESDFLRWLANRSESVEQLIPVPKFWEKILSSTVLKLYQTKRGAAVCLTCNADSTEIRVDRERYGSELIDAYKCPNGHLLFAQPVLRFTPPFPSKETPVSGPFKKLAAAPEAPPPSTPLPFVLTQSQIATMTVEFQQLSALERQGRELDLEERKKLLFLKAILGCNDVESALEKRTLSLEEATNLHAFGGFTFGQIQSLLLSQGNSRGEVLDFLKRVSSGAIPLEDATALLTDVQEWNRIRGISNESREAFFKRRNDGRRRAENPQLDLN